VAHLREDAADFVRSLARAGLSQPTGDEREYELAPGKEGMLETRIGLGMGPTESRRRMKPFRRTLLAWIYQSNRIGCRSRGVHPVFVYMETVIELDQAWRLPDRAEVLELAGGPGSLSSTSLGRLRDTRRTAWGSTRTTDTRTPLATSSWPTARTSGFAASLTSSVSRARSSS
jgi:hypothetical protein